MGKKNSHESNQEVVGKELEESDFSFSQLPSYPPPFLLDKTESAFRVYFYSVGDFNDMSFAERAEAS